MVWILFEAFILELYCKVLENICWSLISDWLFIDSPAGWIDFYLSKVELFLNDFWWLIWNLESKWYWELFEKSVSVDVTGWFVTKSWDYLSNYYSQF